MPRPAQKAENPEVLRNLGGPRDLNVRLYCIEAPETEQEPWGDGSTRHLRGLVGPTVPLVNRGTGRWGRTIGQIFTPEGDDLNLAMVLDG